MRKRKTNLSGEAADIVHRDYWHLFGMFAGLKVSSAFRYTFQASWETHVVRLLTPLQRRLRPLHIELIVSGLTESLDLLKDLEGYSLEKARDGGTTADPTSLPYCSCS